MDKIEYIELFSGIGAFSQAISNITDKKAKCVFAADNNINCAKVYKINYGVESLCDITKKDINEIGEHNFCFFSPPCQAFSKSGKQKGFEEARGTLIFEVFKILEKYHPKYILMENVRNLVSHDNGHTIDVIMTTLKSLGYRLPSKPLILSPHQFGVPQLRERAFLPGLYEPDNVDKPLNIDLGKLKDKNDNSIDTILDPTENAAYLKISPHEKNVLKAWDEFYKGINLDVIGFPVWADYFFDDADITDFPEWKKDFVRKNQKLYRENKTFIDNWIQKYNIFEDFNATQRKFEWQCGTKLKSVFEGLIQSRPSGIRVKVPTVAPALVAIVQTSIIGKYKRRFSIKECLRLQSFWDNFDFGKQNDFECYKQLGNSINVKVLQSVTEALLNYKED